MVNEVKKQEFNKAIKQLQSMVKDKMFISLAEKFYNLKTEMSGITRSAKEKENALLAEQTKEIIKEEAKVEVAPSVVSKPVENKPAVEERKEEPKLDRNRETKTFTQRPQYGSDRNQYPI